MFFIDSAEKVIPAPRTLDIQELKGFLPKPVKKISIEEMNRVISQRRGDNGGIDINSAARN